MGWLLLVISITQLRGPFVVINQNAALTSGNSVIVF